MGLLLLPTSGRHWLWARPSGGRPDRIMALPGSRTGGVAQSGSGNEGRVAMNSPTGSRQPAAMAEASRLRNTTAISSQPSPMPSSAARLARRLMKPWSCQSRSAGPKRGLASSFARSFGEDRPKHRGGDQQEDGGWHQRQDGADNGQPKAQITAAEP